MKNKSRWIFNTLRAYYGSLDWWPGTPYKIMVGAVLVQNTAWGNVDKALTNLGESIAPAAIEAMPMEELVDKIRPSGFYTAKAACLKNLTAWYRQYGYSVQTVQRQSLEKLREELLQIKGIGHETADAILQYSFCFPAFVVDAYLRRFSQRMGLPVALDYPALQAYFQAGCPNEAETLGNYHILILEHGKRHCKKKPLCPGCPFLPNCAYARTQEQL